MDFVDSNFILKKRSLDLSTLRIVKVEAQEKVILITYEEEDAALEEITLLTTSISTDQFAHLAREVHARPRSRAELAALHAKKSEEEGGEVKKPKVSVTVEPVKQGSGNVFEAKPLKRSRNQYFAEPPTEVTKLERVEPAPHNWKDKSIEQSERQKARARANSDPDLVSSCLNYIFKWHAKNDYSKPHQKNHSLHHLLKKVVPDMFKLPFESCRRYYLGQSFPEVTRAYEFQWKKLVKHLDDLGHPDAVPNYIRKHYSKSK